MKLNCTTVEVLDRANGATVETVPVWKAARSVAEASGRDIGEVELELRNGQQHSTAGFVYEPIARVSTL